MIVESDRPYTVLARRFRPQTFEEVVGQEQIGQALRNAIRTRRIAHAYLFTGARGVGKTSTARIFAKALNCPQVEGGVPCNQCEACRAISAGADVDVLEIDGASNRGIDDIRTLRSNVNVRSMRSPFKVYIIDEVHMLTKEAFNALLKTLEEPPPNVKFVFCTTEPNKVPDTILSRCQRFDFGFIDTDDIAIRLAEIARQDGMSVDPEAVAIVARRAGGSMRDAQSLFDQLLAFGSERVDVADVHRLLGTAPDDRLFSIFEAAMSRNQSDALQQLETAFQQGVQLGSLADQMLSFLRDLLVTAAGAQAVPLLSLSPNSRPRAADLAKRWGVRTITAAMQIFTDCRARMQRTTYGRALLELAVVRITLLEELEALSALAAHAPALPAGPAGSQPLRDAARLSSAPAPATFPNQKKSSEDGSRQAEVTDRGPAQSLLERRTLPEDSAAVTGQNRATEDSHPLKFTEESLALNWARVLGELPESLSAHLKKSINRAIFAPNTLEILFGASYFLSKSYCERTESLNRLKDGLNRVFGMPIQVVMKIETASAEKPSNATKETGYERIATHVVQGDPFVEQAVALFGGSVVELRQTRALPGRS